MKKLFVSVLIVAFAQSAFAVRHHEFAVSYGEGTHNQIVNGFANVVGTILTIGYADVTDLTWSGAYNFKYAFHPVNFVGLGVVTSYQTSKGDIVQGTSKNKNGDLRVVVGKAEGKYLTIMPTVSLNWFDFDYVCMYSRLAAGYSLTKTTQTHTVEKVTNHTSDSYWGFQFVPVAIEAGSPLVRAFMELGYGYEGIINVGVKCKF